MTKEVPMSVPYDTFAQGFLSKIKDYHYLQLPDGVMQDAIDGYMKKACAQFNKMCPYNLSQRDDYDRVFTADIPDEDLEPIVDIISEGMVLQWLKPYVYSAENYESVLNTKDFSQYSPAELSKTLSGIHQTVKSNFINAMRDYTYQYGKLDDLALP